MFALNNRNTVLVLVTPHLASRPLRLVGQLSEILFNVSSPSDRLVKKMRYGSYSQQSHSLHSPDSPPEDPANWMKQVGGKRCMT